MSGTICRGIVPTETATLAKETPETLAKLLMDYWEVISRNKGLSTRQIAEQALLAPAKCCTKDIWRSKMTDYEPDCEISNLEAIAVSKAFAYLKEISKILKERYNL